MITDYLADAQAKLVQCGGTLKLRLADHKECPFDNHDLPGYRPHYRCTIKGPSGSYTFDFWDNINAGKKGTVASEYDVLACLEWDCPESFEDFCSEYGYNTDSIKASRTWRACRCQVQALTSCFPSEAARQMLAEIR